MTIFGLKVSKKMFMGIISGLLVIGNEAFDMNIPNETVMSFMGVIAAYIFGQAMVDKEIAKKN